MDEDTLVNTYNISRRQNLGDFSSIVCFRALVVGVEDILGTAAFATLVGAGRSRGKALVASLGGSGSGLAAAQSTLHNALGASGTRLCEVPRIDVEEDGARVIVYLFETICSASEADGSTRRLTFTLGAIQGAIEELSGKAYLAKQTGSVLRGQDFDIITLTRK